MKQIISQNKHLRLKQSDTYIIIGVSVLLITLYLSILRGKNKMAENLLSEKMDLVELNMTDFFSTVEKAFIISYKRGKSGAYQDQDLEELNQQFRPILEGFESISAVDIADEIGNDYMLKYAQGSYSNFITIEGCKRRKLQKIEWTEKNGKLSILKKDSLNLFFDPRLRPWYKGAIETEGDTVFWTKPYQFITNNLPGITISKKWEDKIGYQHVISFDVSIIDISRFVSQMRVSENGKAFIMTNNGQFLVLPKDKRFKTNNELLQYLLIDTDSLAIPEILAAKNNFLSQEQRKELYPFDFGGKKYFLKVKPFVLGANAFQICLLIPENDLTNDINMIRWLVILIIFVIAIMVFMMVKANHSKRKVNLLLLKQKQKLEEKNQEIKDSVHYAKHLQDAILPTSVMIKNIFPQSFILYKPKDIVSGDFYWKHCFDKIIYFAVADCTGHGVPGAMVSVVCANALNRVIKEHGAIEPGNVLDHVKTHVVDTFSQNEDGVADGMDITLCCIDFDKNKLWYSGANNALYRISSVKDKVDSIIKNITYTNRSLYEYPATRQPIGKVSKTEKFKTHEINLEKGDCVYLFTDGFADQFGGVKGKKYMSKPFKNFLLKNSYKPMEEQQVLLENEYNSWRGNLEQIDDICILGIKI